MSDKTQEAPFGTAIGTCDKCDGQGEFLDLRHGIVRCDKCAGAGKVEYVLGIGDAYVQQQQRIEALEAALREIRTIASNRQNAVSWLQHKDALEAIEALVQATLEGGG